MSMEPLSVLIGSWEIVGRSVGMEHDNIRGTTRVGPILGGHLLQLTGTMRVDDVEIESLELVWPDPAGGFGAHVYSSSGHWRPDAGQPATAGSAYEAVMRRIG
jgi:hypothetical protein